MRFTLIRAAERTVLYESYKHGSGGLYMLQYDFLAPKNFGLRANYLLSTFWNSEMNTAKLLKELQHFDPLLAEATAFAFDRADARSDG